MPCYRNCVTCMYVCKHSLPQLLVWASYRHYYSDRLPEAICCCLQTYTVNDVLLVMYCMCLPAFIVTSADKSQLWVLFMQFTPEAICCFFKRLIGVVDIVLHMCTDFHGHLC